MQMFYFKYIKMEESFFKITNLWETFKYIKIKNQP